MPVLLNVHECSDPEVPVSEKGRASITLAEAAHHTRHKVSNDDQVADADTEAFDSNGRIEDDGCSRICHLRQGEE